LLAKQDWLRAVSRLLEELILNKGLLSTVKINKVTKKVSIVKIIQITIYFKIIKIVKTVRFLNC
jgi:hypothetical protein